MTEKDFELLRVLDETRNITKAADRLYLTQSALSKRIQCLEKELETELLIRSRQGIHFTPAGELALDHCRKASREMDLLRKGLVCIGEEISGTLNAGISVNFALYRLPDILAAYHEHYPKVKLKITTGQSRHLYKQMLDGTLDVAVLRGEFAWDDMRFLLSQESICVVCTQRYADRPLSSYMYIDRCSDLSQEALINRWMREQGLSTHSSGFRMDSITACMEMIRRGLGWGLVPQIALDGFDGCIRPCYFENGEPFTRRTYIFCQNDALKLPQVKTFVEALKAYRYPR